MRIEQRLLIKPDEFADQAAERGVGAGLDGEYRGAEPFGQLVRRQGDARDHPEGATASALERPEQVGIGAGVGDPDRAVGSDDLRLQQR